MPVYANSQHPNCQNTVQGQILVTATDCATSSATERSVLERVDSPRTSRRPRTWLLIAEESFKARARETLTATDTDARHTHDSQGIYHEHKENRPKTHLFLQTSTSHSIFALVISWRKLLSTYSTTSFAQFGINNQAKLKFFVTYYKKKPR